VLFKIRATADASGGNAWGIQFIDDVAGMELARWYGFPASAAPRIGSNVLPGQVLNGTIAVSGMNWTDATKRLSKTGAFAGYAWVSGDIITLQTGGPPGTVIYQAYSITAKIDNNTIELADDINGPTNGDISDGTLGGFVTSCRRALRMN